MNKKKFQEVTHKTNFTSFTFATFHEVLEQNK